LKVTKNNLLHITVCPCWSSTSKIKNVYQS